MASIKQEPTEPWQNRWQAGRTGWDLGGPHPLTQDLLNLAAAHRQKPLAGQAYVPGCGRAHDGAYLAAKGFTVTAVDFVPEAIAAAAERYGDTPGLTLAVGDVLEVKPPERGFYDLIFDRAMLCALQPENRRAYGDALAGRLKPGGLFLGILFSEVFLASGEGPPFAVDLAGLHELLASEFTLLAAETRRDGAVSEVFLSELLTVWRKR